MVVDLWSIEDPNLCTLRRCSGLLGIATEHASANPATATMSTDSIAAARHVFCLLAWKLLLITGQKPVVLLCKGQLRQPLQIEAVMAMYHNTSPMKLLINERRKLIRLGHLTDERMNLPQIKLIVLTDYQRLNEADLLHFCFSAWKILQ